MEIVIWGAGAVGLGLANALAHGSHRVRILGRDPEKLAAVSARGISRSGLFGEVHAPAERFATTDRPQSLSSSPPDWLLVCVKAFASDEIARTLEPMAPDLRDRTRLLLCQNGWGNEAPFLPFWPEERLFHARVITGFQLRAQTHVEITAHAAPIALGNIFGTKPDALKPVARRISAGGIPTETTEDMRGVLWGKMLYNCALNPLGAIAGRRYGELVDDATTRALLEAVVREIFDVLDAAELRVAWPNASAYLETFYAELIPPTAAHESSMLQDLRAGRPTEIEALCGAVERLGVTHSVATPVVSSLAALVRAAEHRPLR